MFTLTIDLGNASMRTADDVSRALVKIAARLRGREWDDFSETVMDDNGNKVGEWSLEGAAVGEEEEEETEIE